MEFAWNPQKDLLLRLNRGVGFQDILFAIANGGLLDDRAHPNQTKYPKQRIMVVQLGSYVYEVPYVIGDGYIFCKTIIPSRKATKHYL